MRNKVMLFSVLSALGVLLFILSQEQSCVPPSDDELIEKAIDQAVARQVGSTSTFTADGRRVDVKYNLYPDKTAYLKANENCCEIATQEVLREHLPPEHARKIKYYASVSVITRRLPIGELPNVRDTEQLIIGRRLHHFDRCGRPISIF